MKTIVYNINQKSEGPKNGLLVERERERERERENAFTCPSQKQIRDSTLTVFNLLLNTENPL